MPISFAALLLAGATGAAAQIDSSAWSQFQGEGEHSGAAEGPPPPYRRAWTYGIALVGQRSAWAPVVVPGEDLVVTVAARSVHAIELATGEEAWTFERASGPSIAPAAVELEKGSAVLLTQGDNGETSTLIALDAADGSEIWSAPVDLESTSRTGVTVAGGTAFVGDELGNVYAIDAETGDVAWTAELAGPVTNAITATGDAALALIANREERAPEIVALDTASGDTQWTARPEIASPGSVGVVVGDAVVYGFGDRVVRAYDLADGSERWRSEPLYGAPSPAAAGASADGDVLIAGQLGDLWRLDGDTGERVWDFALNREVILGSPVVVSSATVVVGSSDGSLSAVELDTGELIFSGEPSPGAVGPIAVTPDLLVAARGGAEGGIVAYENDVDRSLIRESSPSSTDPAALLGNFALAAAAVLAVLLGVFRFVAARVGPALADEGPDAEDARTPDHEDTREPDAEDPDVDDDGIEEDGP